MADAYVLVTPGRPLERRALPELVPGEDEVVVEVAGCGIRHTDVGFAPVRSRPRSHLTQLPPQVLAKTLSKRDTHVPLFIQSRV